MVLKCNVIKYFDYYSISLCWNRTRIRLLNSTFIWNSKCPKILQFTTLWPINTLWNAAFNWVEASTNLYEIYRNNRFDKFHLLCLTVQFQFSVFFNINSMIIVLFLQGWNVFRIFRSFFASGTAMSHTVLVTDNTTYTYKNVTIVKCDIFAHT